MAARNGLISRRLVLVESRVKLGKERGIDSEVVVRVLFAERAKWLSYIGSIVRRADMAEDVFQDVCILALKKADSIPDEAHLVNWTRTTARLRALQVLAKRQERQLSLSDEVLDRLEELWSQHAQEDDDGYADAVRHCLDLLSPVARNLVQMRYVEGMEYAKLAESLHRPAASLYVAFSRIHAALADCVSKRIGK
jgi:RNA polymerase sigma factor (sigma-70 family)